MKHDACTVNEDIKWKGIDDPQRKDCYTFSPMTQCFSMTTFPKRVKDERMRRRKMFEHMTRSEGKAVGRGNDLYKIGNCHGRHLSLECFQSKNPFHFFYIVYIFITFMFIFFLFRVKCISTIFFILFSLPTSINNRRGKESQEKAPKWANAGHDPSSECM